MIRLFNGILGWSNKRTGVEFYRSFTEGRHVVRDSIYGVEEQRGGWGRLLADDIERDMKRVRCEGSDVLVIVGSAEELAAVRQAIRSHYVYTGSAEATDAAS